MLEPETLDRQLEELARVLGEPCGQYRAPRRSLPGRCSRPARQTSDASEADNQLMLRAALRF